MRVTIEDRNADGRGRARLPGAQGRPGRVVLVSQAHPGERVTVRVDRTTRGTVQGRVAQLEVADPGRIRHACAHEFRCTGCTLLAVAPDVEAALKHRRILEALATLDRPDVLDRVEPVVTPAGPFDYRHHAKQVVVRRGRRVVLGAYVTGTHHVEDTAGCPVLAPGLRAALDALTATLHEVEVPVHGSWVPGLRYVVARQSAHTGDVLAVLVTSGEPSALAPLAEAWGEQTRRGPLVGVHALRNDDPGDALLRGEVAPLWGEPWIVERLAGFEHRVGPTSFFQINPAAAEVIARAAVELAGGGRLCLELFAGVGALTFPLAERFDRVVAVESAAESVGALAEAASRAERGGVEARRDDAFADGALEGLLSELRPDCVVLDPPRKGLGPLAPVLSAAGPGRLVLVACGVDALARDLPVLLAGGYRVARILPVDQFPRTGHVETVVGLERS